MAIEFDCPHCQTHYRLKDEFGGKTATCKNPNCRKVIPIPKPESNGKPVAPADLDAIAAAAFAEEQARADKQVEQMIPVTCTGCDHTWQVEATKEGKNVRCPECGKVIRVPFRQKTEKADWRTGGGGPTLAKRETGLDREGAFGTVNAGGISEGTAREIVKGRQAEEEPEERRKRLTKRGVLFLAVASVLGVGGYFAFKAHKEIKTDASMAQAVKEQAEQGAKDAAKFEALIHRASAEYRARTAASAEDIKGALTDLQTGRNKVRATAATSADDAAILADVAATTPHLLGTAEQVDKGERVKKDELVKELRQTLQAIPDPELTADAVRAVTRELALRGLPPTLAEEAAQNLTNRAEAQAQVGLELLRINKDKYRSDAEAILTKRLANDDTPGTQALRAALGKPGVAKKEGQPPEAPPPAAAAEADAIKGNVEGAKAARKVPKLEDRAKALAAVGRTLSESHPAEATPILVEAAKALADVKTAVSPWVSIRLSRYLARAGLLAEAESLAASLPDDQTKAWARLEALRGRLDSLKNQKGDDSWLEPVGDSAKVAAAAKAREVLARHNAAQGFGGDYQGVVKKWTIGTARPFGTAGLVLGQLDRDGR